jgi:glycosyltransferase involved in cell wall biosynthesis
MTAMRLSPLSSLPDGGSGDSFGKIAVRQSSNNDQQTLSGAGSAFRIIYITTIPLTLITFFDGFMSFMKKQGFEVCCVSSDGDEIEALQQKFSIDAYKVDMTRMISPFRDALSFFKLVNVFWRVKPDIVHASTPKASFLGMLAAKILAVPARVYGCYGLRLETERGLKRFILWAAEWVSFRCAHVAVPNSASLRKRIESLRLCGAQKMVTLGKGSSHGVKAETIFNPSLFDPNVRARIRKQYLIGEEAVIIGYFGRLVRDKGIIELAHAWRMLREENPELILMLIGDAEPQEPLPDEVLRNFAADDSVVMLGWVNPDQVAEYMSAMDVIVLPTYREGFPNVLLEAAAMELPVVATRVTGCVDAVIDGVTGTLVEPRDAEGLAKALLAYACDPQLRKQHGKAAREMVLRDFLPENILEDALRLYRQLLEKRRPRR